jgi:putative uncharacterized protein RB32ORF054w
MKFKNFLIEVSKDERFKKFNLNIIENNIYYVYRITSYEDGKHYYGSRKAKNFDLKIDFWNYCSSSKRKNDIKKFKSEKYKLKIIKVFHNKDLCNLYEAFLHNYFNVMKNEKFFNYFNCPIFDFTTRGLILIKENNENKFINCLDYDPKVHKICNKKPKGFIAVRDENFNIEYVKTNDERIGKTLFYYNTNLVTCKLKGTNDFILVSKDEFLKNRNLYETTNEGKTLSEETKKKLSIKRLNLEKVICPHCGKKLDVSNAKRWHFENCKKKINQK